jgi:IS605 OrfB family transposase
VILTYRYRIKDATSGKHLDVLAKAVNLVWNYCGDIQNASRRYNKPWPSSYDLIRLTTGSSLLLGLHSDTVQAICKQFVSSRDAHGRRPRWRSKRSLGWVPFAAARAIKFSGEAVIHLKRRYRLWFSRNIEGEVKCGNFSKDARGRWYLNLYVEVDAKKSAGQGEIALDLGLKTLATGSDGSKISHLRHYRQYEQSLAQAQRARNKKRVRAIHAKIANSRRHHLHVQSSKLVRENKLIIVGDVNAMSLRRTRMVKSILDAAWSSFRSMLRYKAIRHGVRYIESDERWSSATCSTCGARTGPKGIKGLRVREWVCASCGDHHDRDTNAARNLLLGLERQPLIAGMPAV